MGKLTEMQMKIAELLQANEAAMTLVEQLTAERDALAAQLAEIRKVWDEVGGWPDTAAEMEYLRVAIEGEGV